MKKKHFFIKKSSAIAWVVASAMLAIPFFAIAQEQNPAVYALVEYMKVKQGDGQKYTDLERNYWKKIHQERVKSGEIDRWVLYEVRFAGSDDDYNYVTATLISNPDKLENPYEGIDAAKILAGEDVDKIMKETAESRQLVKSNLIRMVSTVNSAAGPAPFKYVQIDFMKVKPENDARYLDVENNVWKPVHQQFIKDGSRAGWTLWQAVYPSGAGMEYQYATSNYISDFSKLMSADYNKAFTAAHPGGNTDKLMEDTDKSRDLVRSELWQVLDSTK